MTRAIWSIILIAFIVFVLWLLKHAVPLMNAQP